MDIPLHRRALNFLRKAGPAALLRKLWVRLKRRFAARGWLERSRFDERLYQAKLKSLPVVDGHVVVPVLDFKMKLRALDQGLSRQLVLHGVRERDAVEYLRPQLRSFKTIIEIGANQGYYAILEALNSPPDAKIYAFEPHPANIETLKMNAELNGCVHKFAQISQAAVSNKTGTAMLHVHDLSNWHSLSRVELAGGWRDSIEVPTVSLDGFCRTNGIMEVDFVRMDVEGHEAEIIEGGTEILTNSPECVMFIELHTGLLRESNHAPEDMMQRIRSLGFRSVTVCGQGKQHSTENWDTFIRNLELILEEYGNHVFFTKGSDGT